MYVVCSSSMLLYINIFFSLSVCVFRYCRLVAVPNCCVRSLLLTCPRMLWTSWEDAWLPKRWPPLSCWETAGRGPGDDSTSVDVLQECVPVVNWYIELRNQPMFAHFEMISVRWLLFPHVWIPELAFQWLNKQYYLGVIFCYELSKKKFLILAVLTSDQPI